MAPLINNTADASLGDSTVNREQEMRYKKLVRKYVKKIQDIRECTCISASRQEEDQMTAAILSTVTQHINRKV